MKRFIPFAAAVAFALTTGAAQAQTYPNKPVQVIIAAAAGNSPDVSTRVVAEKLSRLWGQQIVMINRPGAGGMIAAQAAAASSVEPDGYTLYAAQASTYTVLPIMMEGKMTVDLHKSFRAIGMIGEQPIAVAVNNDVPVRSIAELIEYSKKQKEPVLFGASNRGGQSHLTGELFTRLAKANLTFVHAQGTAASLNDIIAGRLPVMFEGIAGLRPGIEGKSIRVLGIASQKRLPNLPDLPAMNETVPNMVSSGWIVLMAPKNTPDDIVAKISADLRKVTAERDVNEKLYELGTYTRDLTPAQAEEFLVNEEKLWWPIVRDVNKAQEAGK